MKSVAKDTQAVTEIVGIILMAVIVTVAATALYITMDQTTGSKLHATPMVSMRQSGDHIVIIGVQLGSVVAADTNISIIESNGNVIGFGILHTAGANIVGGDTITIPSGLLSSGVYTIQMKYMFSQVGVANYVAA